MPTVKSILVFICIKLNPPEQADGEAGNRVFVPPVVCLSARRHNNRTYAPTTSILYPVGQKVNGGLSKKTARRIKLQKRGKNMKWFYPALAAVCFVIAVASPALIFRPAAPDPIPAEASSDADDAPTAARRL